jgi:hypothetical protein
VILSLGALPHDDALRGSGTHHAFYEAAGVLREVVGGETHDLESIVQRVVEPDLARAARIGAVATHDEAI